VVYYLTVSVFLPNSETAIYSKAFERVRNDPQACGSLEVMLISDEAFNR
jgi:hypothetical protein